MKTVKLIRASATLMIGAAAFIYAVPNARALDNWQNVNDFQGVPGMSAGSLALQTDPTTRTLLFDAGSAYMDNTSGIRPAILRISTDQGGNWTIVDDFCYSGWQGAYYRAVACDPNNNFNLYGAGFVEQTTPSLQDIWFARESHDGGTTWSTTDDLAGSLSTPIADCAAIGVAPSGDVYAAGTCTNSWTVRKRVVTSTLTNYVTVDSYPGADNSYQSAQGMGFNSNGGVFVVGFTRGSNGLRQWLTRKGANQGLSWSTVDRFVSDRNWTASEALCMVVDASGKIYVAGHADYAKGNKTTNYALVRRSTDGGTTWSTVDQSIYGIRHRPWAMTIDAAGNILICGYVQTANGDHWVVRKGTPAANGSVAWVISDDYQLTPGQSSQARGIVCDAARNLYVTGRGVDTTGNEHWITRKLAAP